ncbi:YybH family protein [Salinimicrobium flavum]|uniref:YybH family protein n=1 Tax=Salinimicrobium flavum TaxID=1737065 RepID=A0ABW5IX41_9FLAO
MKNIALLLLFIFIVTGCAEEKTEVVAGDDTANEVLKAYNNMYNSYAQGTDEFFDYYENDFVRVPTTGEVQKGVEGPRAEWNDLLKTHSLYLEKYGEPEIILSENQVVTIGDYTEYFIDRETKDSAYNRGVYIAAWRKQDDGSWKISMDTWQAGLEKK